MWLFKQYNQPMPSDGMWSTSTIVNSNIMENTAKCKYLLDITIR